MTHTVSQLSCRQNDDNGLSFELLVDGVPLGDLVGAKDTCIPYWIFKDDLPTFPPHDADPDSDVRIVCVCSCGEYGCGHTRCRVVFEENVVVFRDFDSDVTPEGRKLEFRFELSDYRSVIEEILKQVHQMESQGVEQEPEPAG